MMNATHVVPPVPHCLQHQTVLDIVSGVVLIVGAMAAYVPQWVSIITRKSSFGVNFTYLSLAWLSNLLVAGNASILKYPVLACCWRQDGIAAGQCLALQLPLLQIVLPFVYGFVSQALFIYYCKAAPPVFSPLDAHKLRYRAKAVFAATNLLLLIVLIAAVVMYFMYDLSPETLGEFATALGYAGAVANVIMWLPQIVTSYKLRTPGSLSVISLLVLCLGNVLVFFYQYVGNHTAFSTCFQNAISAVELAFLLSMLCYFRIVDGKPKPLQDAAAEPVAATPSINSTVDIDATDEHTKLLQ
jgi:uncharacterized protein with PQ loop repeat